MLYSKPWQVNKRFTFYLPTILAISEYFLTPQIFQKQLVSNLATFPFTTRDFLEINIKHVSQQFQ